MSELETPTADELLPLPARGWGDGWDWMDGLASTPWVAVPNWGHDGWDLGQWPYVIVVTCAPTTGASCYGVATYVEGDLDPQAYATDEERVAAIDRIAEFYWRIYGRGPELPATGPLVAEHCGVPRWMEAVS